MSPQRSFESPAKDETPDEVKITTSEDPQTAVVAATLGAVTSGGHSRRKQRARPADTYNSISLHNVLEAA